MVPAIQRGKLTALQLFAAAAAGAALGAACLLGVLPAGGLLAFLAGIQGVPARHLGVSRFGQAGDLADVYRYHGIDEDSMVRAVLDLAE